MAKKVLFFLLIFLYFFFVPFTFFLFYRKRYWLFVNNSKESESGFFGNKLIDYLKNEQRYINVISKNTKNPFSIIVILPYCEFYYNGEKDTDFYLRLLRKFNKKCIVSLIKNHKHLYISNKSFSKTIYLDNSYQTIYQSIITFLVDILNSTKRCECTEKSYVIVTGDDLGRNESSNEGILDALDKKIITQTSLMTNSGFFVKAENNPFRSSTSLHFNYLENVKLGAGTVIFDVNNKDSISYKLIKPISFIYINKIQRQTISDSTLDQIKTYIESGYDCVAFDSHGHMHVRLPIAKIMAKMCVESHFRIVRLPKTGVGFPLSFKNIYKKIVTNYYKKMFITADFFFSCYDLIHINLNKYQGKIVEVMTHPYSMDGITINRRDICFESLYRYLSKYNVELIDYNRLIRIKERS